MTIAIGMRFDDGYLLAADTLVTVSGHYKGKRREKGSA